MHRLTWLLIPWLAVALHAADGWNVRDFGAVGDGKADDTAAFQKALDAAKAGLGGVVSVPTGKYLIAGHLDVPDHVTLEGVFRAPTARSQGYGSTLLATESKGQADGTPFLFLHANATLKGLTIFYPEQDRDKPTPYPWCVRGWGDNASIIDVLMVNPWQAVDFATHPCGRHLIRGLYAQALYRGLQVDRCLDIGRIEDVHFWPFWDVGPSAATELTKREGIAFSFRRTDWEYVSGSFCISYNVGMEFVTGGDATGPCAGPGNVLLTQSGADCCVTAVRVVESQRHAGISFANSQIYGDLVVEPTNTGMVRFTGCGLFGSMDGQRGTALAKLAGKGRVSFENCSFNCIDPANRGEFVIEALAGRLSVQNCQFLNAPYTAVNPEAIRLGQQVAGAQILGNEFNHTMGVINHAGGQVIIANNLENTDTEEYYVTNGGRWWPLDRIEVGTETADLAPNGGFTAGEEGWTRIGPASVEKPVAPFLDERVMVARPGAANEPVGQYWRGLTLEPDSDYVLSAYLWNFTTPEQSARVFVDLLGVKPLNVYAMPGKSRAGIFVMMPFSTKDTGTKVSLRAWYDMPKGWAEGKVAMQAARIAVTKAERFKAPRERAQ